MEPTIKYYTVADLKQWLIHNKPAEGLSDRIIAPQRAYAIMNNPFVNDDDAVLCAIFEDGEPAAYTAAFPEVLERPKRERIWWFTTLYCRPESTGKGYGLIVVGTLAEIYGVDNCFDMDGAAETICIFKCLGHKCTFPQRYVFKAKKIQMYSVRGRLAFFVNKIQNLIKRFRIVFITKKLKKCNYKLSYSTFIDDEAYSFILRCSNFDFLIRKQEMLNWNLHYPFVVTSPVIDRVEIKIYSSFSCNTYKYNVNSVKVYLVDSLIGIYVYRIMDKELSIVYLYYLPDKSEIVFSSIAEHFIALNANGLKTTSKDFSMWFKRLKLTDRFVIENQSFSYPKQFVLKKDCFTQMGDGDAFV